MMCHLCWAMMLAIHAVLIGARFGTLMCLGFFAFATRYNMVKYVGAGHPANHYDWTVIECLTKDFIAILRKARPDTPVLLIEGHDETVNWMHTNGSTALCPHAALPDANLCTNGRDLERWDCALPPIVPLSFLFHPAPSIRAPSFLLVPRPACRCRHRRPRLFFDSLHALPIDPQAPSRTAPGTGIGPRTTRCWRAATPACSTSTDPASSAGPSPPTSRYVPQREGV